MRSYWKHRPPERTHNKPVSKKKNVENHGHAIALYIRYYNFARVHQTLRVTQGIEAGITEHVWSIDELCALLPKPEHEMRRAVVSSGISLLWLNHENCIAHDGYCKTNATDVVENKAIWRQLGLVRAIESVPLRIL